MPVQQHTCHDRCGLLFVVIVVCVQVHPHSPLPACIAWTFPSSQYSVGTSESLVVTDMACRDVSTWCVYLLSWLLRSSSTCGISFRALHASLPCGQPPTQPLLQCICSAACSCHKHVCCGCRNLRLCHAGLKAHQQGQLLQNLHQLHQNLHHLLQNLHQLLQNLHQLLQNLANNSCRLAARCCSEKMRMRKAANRQ